MRIFITGSTGLIGRRLVLDRLQRGDQVVILARRPARAETMFAARANPNVHVVTGDVMVPGPWQKAVEGCQAVVHLAGAGLADHRWSAAYKRLIVRSRIDGTHQVVEAIAAAASAPRVLVSASATGFYGDTGERETDESASAAEGEFLADLVSAWEREALKARELGVRVVPLRTGIVLDRRGGLVGRLIRPFRLFVGGPVGSGRQWVSWIHWRDMIGLIDLALRQRSLDGPLNCVAPNPVRFRALARALGRVVGRPSWLPIPAPVLRAAVGEMARYALSSQRIVPKRAIEQGYRFVYRDIEPAMASLFNGRRANPGPRTAPPPPQAAPPRSAPSTGPRPAAPIRLLAIDVDGTLLRSDGVLSDGVTHACRSAARAGCVVVLATARPPRLTRPLVERLDVIGPMITYNGAAIWNPLDDRPQHHEPMAGSLAGQVVDAARGVAPNVLVAVEVLDRRFTDRLDPSLRGRWADPLQPDVIAPLPDVLAKDVTQLVLFGAPGDIAAARAVLEERFWRPGAISLLQPNASVLQIAHRLVDKGIALQRVAARLGVSRQQVMAIGDALNDTGMIGWSGFGAAVANAVARVRELADVVVPTNDEQGVARAIHRFIVGRK